MEKRNSIVLTAIAVAVLLVTVVGATFAYFASNQDDITNGNITLVTNTGGSASVFDASGGSISMNITSELMQQTGANNSAVATNTASITVNFLSGTNNYNMTCTYDIVFAWDSGSDQYTAYTSENTAHNKEFTIVATRTGTPGTDGTNAMSTEKELFQALTGTNGNTVVKDATITNSSQNTKSTNTWSITMKFYNLSTNQKELANKHFSGKFSVSNVRCAH